MLTKTNVPPPRLCMYTCGCSHYAVLTNAQNDAEAPVVKVLNGSQRVWRDKRNNDYEFQTVYSLGNFDVYKGTKDEFNKVFQASGLGIMRRECKDCRGDQHNDKFFVRKTSPERFDAWQYLVRSQGLRISLSLSQILSVSVSISLFPPPPPFKLRTDHHRSHNCIAIVQRDAYKYTDGDVVNEQQRLSQGL